MAWQCGWLTAGGLQRADQGPLGWLWAGGLALLRGGSIAIRYSQCDGLAAAFYIPQAKLSIASTTPLK